MKTFTKVLATIALSLSVVSLSNAAKFIAADKDATTKLCMTAASGSRISMHQAIKDSNLSKSYIYRNVQCNEQPISEFVAQYNPNADKVNALFNQSQRYKVNIIDLAAL